MTGTIVTFPTAPSSGFPPWDQPPFPFSSSQGANGLRLGEPGTSVLDKGVAARKVRAVLGVSDEEGKDRALGKVPWTWLLTLPECISTEVRLLSAA